jgi:hypothetical protein
MVFKGSLVDHVFAMYSCMHRAAFVPLVLQGNLAGRLRRPQISIVGECNSHALKYNQSYGGAGAAASG